jgi:hypothetical protein
MHGVFLALVLGAAADAATTLDAGALLKPPSGLRGDFTVAGTPPRVDVALFTDLPAGGRDTLWSSWGDGCLASNGKYYTSAGDHRGADANSYVYEYDPQSRQLTRVLDVARLIGQKPGDYGHGKIHSGIHEAADDWLYFTTYWGKHREIEAAFAKGYQGSLLLRYHAATGKAENLGAIVPRQGLPASHFDARRGLLYFHAVYNGDIAVYDIAARKVKFQGGSGDKEGQRAFLADTRGRVYFSGSGGHLSCYDPATNKITATKAKLPATPGGRRGDWLRAAARPARDGRLYGMTAAGRLFAFDPSREEVKDLGPNFADGDYTAVMVLSPDDRFLYYAPGAHGSSGRWGTPVVQYKVATGRRKVLAFLNEPVRKALRYNLGGTYNLQIDAAGERLFFTFNGAPLGEGARKEATFGQPCVVVVTIPRGER